LWRAAAKLVGELVCGHKEQGGLADARLVLFSCSVVHWFTLANWEREIAFGCRFVNAKLPITAKGKHQLRQTQTTVWLLFPLRPLVIANWPANCASSST